VADVSASSVACIMFRVGQDHINIRCIHGTSGREITKYTVINGVYIRFWPTLSMLVCALYFVVAPVLLILSS